MTPTGTPTVPADVSTDERRRQVLEAAARLLAEQGPQGLSLRAVATAAGGSTQIVYTLFGGKPGLVDGLYAEGFRRLAAAMSGALAAAPPPGDPDRLMAAGRGYLAFSRDEPAFFAVMFGRAIPGFTPSVPTRAYGRECTFGQLVREVQTCLDAGTLAGTSAEELARQCWLTVHGLASLSAAGLLALPDPEAFTDRVLRTPLLAFTPSAAS